MEASQPSKTGMRDHEGQLADIGTYNVIELDLTPRMKYIMVRHEN